jgi:hypothetical protein
VVVTRSKGFDRTTGDGGYIVDGPIWMKGSLSGGSVFLERRQSKCFVFLERERFFTIQYTHYIASRKKYTHYIYWYHT